MRTARGTEVTTTSETVQTLHRSEQMGMTMQRFDEMTTRYWTDGGYTMLWLHHSDGTIIPLTPCCETSATGSMDGTACRLCYEEIDDIYGLFYTSVDEMRRGGWSMIGETL